MLFSARIIWAPWAHIEDRASERARLRRGHVFRRIRRHAHASVGHGARSAAAVGPCGGPACPPYKIMLIAERHSRLKEMIGRRGMADLDALAAELGVSQSTVRRDVELLQQAGLVSAHARRRDLDRRKTPQWLAPDAFDQRMSYHVDLKRQIARAARGLVQPGQTVLIDGGTTTFYFAQELLDTELQLVTNSLPIANLFLNNEKVELILTGGLVYPRYGVLLGPMAEEALATIHTKTLFLSVAGIHEGSLYNQNSLLVQSELRSDGAGARDRVADRIRQVRPAGAGAIGAVERNRYCRHRRRSDGRAAAAGE